MDSDDEGMPDTYAIETALARLVGLRQDLTDVTNLLRPVAVRAHRRESGTLRMRLARAHKPGPRPATDAAPEQLAG